MGKSTTSFPKGVSGNAAGRPPGKTPRVRFRDAVEADMPELVKTLVDLAKGGDVQALKVILSKVIPDLKPTASEVVLRSGGSLQDKGDALVNAMAAGKITPDAALVALNAIAAQVKIVEQGEIVKRLDQLEALICPTAKP